ncbi:hypothetical protein BH24GEM2_BH24GEM2_04990 [soil metagenome]
MIELRTLGAIDLRHPDGSPVTSVLAQPKRLALLAFLAVKGGSGFQRRDTLLGLFWPDSDTASARRSLVQSVYVLRRALGADVLLSRGDDEVGIAPGRVRCDAAEFQRLVACADPGEALELYRGELLPGFFLSGLPEWEQWLDGERLRLSRLATQATNRLVTEAEARGDWADGVEWARRAAAFSPDDERSLRRLLALLEGAGDRSGALREYEQFARRLRAEHDTSPAPETQALAATLRAPLPAPPLPVSPPPKPAPAAASSPPAAEAIHPPEPRRPARTRSRAAYLAAGAMLLALLVYGGIRIGRGSDPIPARDLRLERVAVLPFNVRGDARLAYLGPGMADLLAGRLDGAGNVQTVDPTTLIGFLAQHDANLSDHDRGQAVARRFGAGWYVLGSVVGAGGSLQLRASLFGDDGRVRATAEAGAADESQLFVLVDEVARKLLAGWGFGGEITRTAAVSTRSLPAAKAFLRGEQAYRTERYGDAASAFRAAVDADSGFALAHYRLSLALGRQAGERTAEADSAAGLAARLSGRLTEHDRLMVMAHAALSGGDPRRAYLLYRAVVAAHPDNVEAWYELGELMLRDPMATGGATGQARLPFERVLSLAPRHLGALANLARLEAGERDPAARLRLEQLVRRAEAIRPHDARTREMRRLQVFAHGDDAAHRVTLDSFRSLDDATVWELAWKVASHAQRLDRAEQIMQLLLAPGRPIRTKARAHTALAKLHQARGRPTMAEQEVRAAGQIDAAPASLVRHAPAPERWTLADSLRAAGRVPEAVDAYTRLIDDIGYDVAYLAPARLARAELYDRGGHRAEAIEDYRRFLELWLDAEPGLRPTVVRVEQRLRELALP